jgi:tRNA nucleotidyltransferase (CCA-adding enzyme)
VETRAGARAEADRKNLFLALLTYRLTKAQLERFLNRLRFSQDVGKLLREVKKLRSRAHRLDRPDLKPSQIYRLLHYFSAQAIMAFCIALDSAVGRENVQLYLNQLRWVRSHIKGGFLKEQGIPAGPIYSRILDRLLHARLDGEVRTASEEEAMAKKLIASWRRRTSRK